LKLSNILLRTKRQVITLYRHFHTGKYRSERCLHLTSGEGNVSNAPGGWGVQIKREPSPIFCVITRHRFLPKSILTIIWFNLSPLFRDRDI